jgi:hypothetical protein
MIRQLLFHFIVDLFGNLALEIALNAATATRLLQTCHVTADVCAAARFFTGEIQRDLSLRVTNDPQQLKLRLVLVTAEALTLGNFAYLLRLCHGISPP